MRSEFDSLHRAAQTEYMCTENRVRSTTACRSSHSMREGQGQGFSAILLLFECRMHLYYRIQCMVRAETGRCGWTRAEWWGSGGTDLRGAGREWKEQSCKATTKPCMWEEGQLQREREREREKTGARVERNHTMKGMGANVWYAKEHENK